jgi:two-component system CheB/CheR fusion protein
MTSPPSEHDESKTPATDERDDDFFVVGIGASAGGIGALKTFFDHMSEESGMAFVVVQHLDPNRESELPALLGRQTTLPVSQVTDQTPVESDHVYIIPPGKSLSIEDGVLHLSRPSRPRRERAPIDLFFRSLAESQGRNAVGIVLSGSGSGGTVGIRAINEVGGFTLAQDPSEAAYSSMPRSAVSTGVVDAVLPLAELTQRLMELRRAAPRIQLPDQIEALSDEERETFDDILDELQVRTGYNFADYKRGTVLRRVNRRMQVQSVDMLQEYFQRLRQSEEEAEALFQELLISVTRFFRDPEAFEVLEEEVIPTLFEDRNPNLPLRVWVPGCATGEEAYSIGMLLMERSLEVDWTHEIQIFATDADESALEQGRTGLYSTSIEGDVPPERLQRFFKKESGGYAVRKGLRDQVVFAPHNLLKDPPFSELDLVACRNLLIYMQEEMQQRILEIFHYALRPEGALFVGRSESTSQAADLFTPVDSTHGIYRPQALGPQKRERPPMPWSHSGSVERPTHELQPQEEEETESYRRLHRTILEFSLPPTLLVDEDRNLVYVGEGAQQFLEYPTGEPTGNVLEIIRSELRVDLQTALFQAFRPADEETERAALQGAVQLEDESTQVQYRVHRVEDLEVGTFALIVLEEKQSESPVERELEDGEEEVVAEKIHHLERELDRTKKQLSLTIEKYQARTQDLQASNEELQSVNEELTSMTEELETSKEELQSVNEELITVNDELQTKNDELTEANSDLKNLMASTGIGVIFLDRQLDLRRYTAPAQELFNFIPGDVGRPLSDLRGKIDYEDEVSLVGDAERVLDSLETIEREVQKGEEQWYLVRLLPYRTEDDKIDGVVITFIDITDRIQTEIELREREQELRTLTESLEKKVGERTQEIRELSSELTLAEQRERDRLSRILHDELQQDLTALQMRAKALEADTSSEEYTTVLKEMQETLDSTLERTRSLTAELSPPVLDSTAFEEIMQWLASHVEDAYGLDVETEVVGEPRISREDLRMLLFRLVRELLFNVVKHAGVDEARLRSRLREDGHLVVEVIDEGDGFDPESSGPTEIEGSGLYRVHNRLEMFDGRLELDSIPGDGTRAALVLPLDREEE